MVESLMVIDAWFKIAKQTEVQTLERLYSAQVVEIGNHIAVKLDKISKITNSLVTKLPKLSK